jgi:hypothetical protein
MIYFHGSFRTMEACRPVTWPAAGSFSKPEEKMRKCTSDKHQATSCDKMSLVNLSDSNHLVYVLKIDFNERYNYENN